jgi:hypothetical protein
VYLRDFPHASWKNPLFFRALGIDPAVVSLGGVPGTEIAALAAILHFMLYVSVRGGKRCLRLFRRLDHLQQGRPR